MQSRLPSLLRSVSRRSRGGAAVETGRLVGQVCTAQGRIVAYCYVDITSGEIVVLVVLPPHEGRGIGKVLLSKVMQQLREAGHTRLFLGCSRDPAHRSYEFYRYLGWISTGQFDDHGDEILEFRWQNTESRERAWA
jgi:GNAT superfamily N-acetyltransferase